MKIDSSVTCIKKNIVKRIECLQSEGIEFLLKALLADNTTEQKEHLRRYEERHAREKELKYLLKDILFRYLED